MVLLLPISYIISHLRNLCFHMCFVGLRLCLASFKSEILLPMILFWRHTEAQLLYPLF